MFEDRAINPLYLFFLFDSRDGQKTKDFCFKFSALPTLNILGSVLQYWLPTNGIHESETNN